MAYNYEYPYTDVSRVNSDWILHRIKELCKEFDEFVLKNQIKYHDPIQWNITTQYEQYEIVTDNDIAYLSKKPVPSGVNVTNEDYWLKIADFGTLYTRIKESIASADDGASTTATDDRAKGTLIWLNDVLYEVIRDINTGDAYVSSGLNPNIEERTIEEFIDNLSELFNDEIGDINDAITLINNRIDVVEDEFELYLIKGTTASEIQTEIDDNVTHTCYFKRGVIYELDGALTLPSGCRLWLNGATIKRVDTVHNIIVLNDNCSVWDGVLDGNYSADNLQNTNPSDRFSNIFGYDKDSITIRDIECIGNCSAETQTEGDNGVICLDACTNVTIDNCYCHDNAGTCVFVGYTATKSEYVRISNCYFKNNQGSGISGGMIHSVVTNCVCEYAGIEMVGQYHGAYTGISINGEDVTVSNCVSSNNSGSGYTLGHNNTNDKNLVADNLIAFGNTLDGFSVGADSTVISNSLIYDNARFSVALMVNDIDLMITNCTFKNGKASRCNGNVTFDNCYFYKQNGAEQLTRGLSRFYNCKFVDVAPTYAYILVSNNVTAIISNCQFINTNSSEYATNCVQGIGTGSVIYFMDNLHTGMTDVAGAGTSHKRALPT